MATPDNLLVLDPPTELRFVGPFTEMVLSTITLHNPTTRRVCFKVKTTAPKRYCVRPNCGVVDPGKTLSVTVMLQPFEYDPSESRKHKFMIQTMFAPDGDEYINQDTLWRDALKEDLRDSKIRCIFVMPDEAQAENNNTAAGAYNALRDSENRAPGVGKEATVPANAPLTPKQQQQTSPQAAYKASFAETEQLLQKEEMKRLRDEIKSLRQENVQLLDEVLSLRAKRNVPSQPASSESNQPQQRTLSPQRFQREGQDQTSQLMLYVVGSVAVLLLGYILGKFIL